MQVLKALNRIEVQQARMEQKLDSLTEPMGRISNLEARTERHSILLEAHDRKIQQARGGIAVIGFLAALFEAFFHKVWK